MDSQVLERKKQELELDDFIQSTSDAREIKPALVVIVISNKCETNAR